MVFAVAVLVAGSGMHTAATAQAGRGGPPQRLVDPRVEQRTYQFEDTNEELPYAVFVSSKVRPDQESPLIIALHGLGGDPNSLLRGNAIDLAEEGGYILVGPMGYNPGGWYGSPVITLGGRGGRGGTAEETPENLEELSEKDVMNVLALIREEFNVDDGRTFLMGHSMGGGGTWHLGIKHPSLWAAIAPISPAIYRAPTELEKIKHIPVIVVQGAKDRLVPVDGVRKWVDKMKQLEMTHEYIEDEDGGHIFVAFENLPKIFDFFNKHRRNGAKEPSEKLLPPLEVLK